MKPVATGIQQRQDTLGISGIDLFGLNIPQERKASLVFSALDQKSEAPICSKC